MTQYEYKVVPAPTKGEKAKGVKQPVARFALSLEGVLNQMAEGGWEFVRAEMLPNEERSGLSKTTKEWRNLLIFKRERVVAPRASETEALAPLVTGPPVVAPPTRPAVVPKPAEVAELETETDGEEDAFAHPEPVDAASPTPFEKLTVEEATVPLRPLRGWRDRS